MIPILSRTRVLDRDYETNKKISPNRVKSQLFREVQLNKLVRSTTPSQNLPDRCESPFRENDAQSLVY